MKVEGRFLGLGLAVVDYKVRQSGNLLTLPTNREALLSFLEDEIVKKQRDFVLCAGGSISGAMNTFAALSENSFRLFASVGNDSHGEIYKTTTSVKLGIPQIIEGENTGIWVALLGEGGNPQGLSYHGAGDKVRISKRELQEEKNSLFITDITSCKKEEIFNNLDDALRIVKKDQGIFALGLGGARPDGIPREKLLSIFSSFSLNPDMVFGNEQEFKYATGMQKIESVMDSGFPNSRLLIVTRNSQGVIIRFEGKYLTFPARLISPSRIIDQTGAGDAFIGTMLGYLYAKPYSSWTYIDVQKAADLACFASSLILQSKDSRLQDNQLTLIKESM